MAACGGAGSGAGSAAPASLPLIRVGDLAWKSDAGFFLMADKQGFYQQAGVRVEHTVFNDNVTLIKALISGEVDVAESSPGPVIVADANGAKMKIFAGTLVGNSQVLFVKTGINTPQDLAGHSVGISAAGSYLDELLTVWLRQVGVDPSKVVRVNAGPSNENIQALLAGKIDAGVAPIDYADMLTKDGKFHILTKFSESVPGEIRYIVATSDQVLKARPKDLTAYLQAYAQGLRYAVTHRDAEIALTAETLKLPTSDATIQQTYDTQVGNRYVAPDMAVTPEQIDAVQQAQVLMKRVPKTLTVSDLLDLSLQKQVAAGLGPFSWPQGK